MRFRVANGLGGRITDPSAEEMRAFLDDVDETDEEHGAAWLETDEGYSLDWSGFGLSFSGPEQDERPRHMRGVSRERALELWMALAEGRLDEVARCPWRPPSEIVPDPEHEARVRARQLELDRKFYDQLGEERPGVPCRTDRCERGAVRFSVFCRKHHFESVQERASPFD